MKLSWRQAALWAGSLASLLVGYGANQAWSDIRDHEKRITSSEKVLELIPEVRSDVREIRDAVRRLEGARDVSRTSP